MLCKIPYISLSFGRKRYSPLFRETRDDKGFVKSEVSIAANLQGVNKVSEACKQPGMGGS